MEIDLTENELIVEFMGIEYYTRVCPKMSLAAIAQIVDYSYRWEMLMPVVEKIEGLGHKIIISNTHGQYCNIMYGVNLAETSDTKAMGVGETKIEAVYKAVVAFIQWYNQNRKQ